MKFYKLKEDLPTFKAGDKFCLNNNGDLISVEERIVAYSAKTLDKFPNILKDWFGRVNTGFYLDEKGYIVEYAYDEDSYILNYRKSIGNDFKTEKEARKYKEYLIALQTIKDDAKGFKPDWESGSQVKYYGCLNYDDCLDWGNTCDYQNQGAVYFETREDLEESFEKHCKEWLIVLGVENEDR